MQREVVGGLWPVRRALAGARLAWTREPRAQGIGAIPDRCFAVLPLLSSRRGSGVIDVLPQEQWPRWLSVMLGGLVLIGIIAVAYALFELVRLVRQT
jgi:hypothetical protein